MSKPLAQGSDVDRIRPSWLHREYWILTHLRRALEAFADQHQATMQGSLVVDFGSGDSPYRPFFERHGAVYKSADIPPVMLGCLEIDPLTGKVNLPDESASFVISTQVLEHVINVDAYLREIRRILKPGGQMLLSTHGTFRLHRHPTDMRRWTTDGLTYDIEHSGFKVLSMTPKIGLLATTTHMRAMMFGLLARRPLLSWIPPIAYLFCNLKMAIEDACTPASVMEMLPELLIAVAVKE